MNYIKRLEIELYTAKEILQEIQEATGPDGWWELPEQVRTILVCKVVEISENLVQEYRKKISK